MMGKKWDDAHKLCRFILIYEPDNKEANEFLPLIKQKLEEKENDDDEEDSSDDEDESGSDDDDDDDSDDSTTSTSSSDEETDDDDDVQTPRTMANKKKSTK